MDELLATLFAMPTLPWTCLVIVSVVYWLTVILGALDLDVLGAEPGEQLRHGGLHDAGLFHRLTGRMGVGRHNRDLHVPFMATATGFPH